MPTPPRLQELRMEVSQRDAVEWSDLLDDRNPLHSNPEAGVAHGIGRGIVSPGPANMAHLMTLLLRSFPGVILETFEARFSAAVLAPTTVVARGVIDREEVTDDGLRLHCTLELLVADTVAISARARVRLRAA